MFTGRTVVSAQGRRRWSLVLAVVLVLVAPKGLWGLVSGNGRIRLFPVGYSLRRQP